MRRTFARLVPVLALAACGKAVDTGDPGSGADTGEESCFNGVDDDADDLADCADPKCAEVATCVPLDEALALEVGALVGADEPCPAGFEGGEVVVHRDLDPGVCEGCDCTIGSTTCTATVWYYPDEAACTADEGLTGGVEVGVPITFECPAAPVFDSFIFGMRVDVAAEQSCTGSGSAEPGPVSWGRSMKFCRASSVGGGCSGGAVCVGRQAAPEAQCSLAAGEVACEGYASAEVDWYTGFDDGRTCGACTGCAASGGSCDGVGVLVGSDYKCGVGPPDPIADETRSCFGQVYSPPAQLIGD